MGGRGGNYSRSADVAVSAFGADGAEIDLSGSPLKYGDKDANIPGKVRASLEAFENQRYKNKIEFSRFVDADGNVIEDNRGGSGSVRASYTARLTAEAMSHNHPRKTGGILGGTFSTGDLNNFARFNQTHYRATASEGTYSISKLKGFDKAGFAAHVKSENAVNTKAYKAATAKIDSTYKANGYASYSDYIKAHNTAFNAYLVAEHNSLLSGQKLYGYSYTLERRNK